VSDREREKEWRERERERERGGENISFGEAIASVADNSTDKNLGGGIRIKICMVLAHGYIRCSDNGMFLVRVFDASATGLVDCDTAE